MEKLNWVDERYEKHYKFARWILTLGVAILLILATWYDDLVIAMREVAGFTIVTWLLSYPTSSLSMKMINYSDKLNKTWKKVLFYLATLVAAFILYVILIKVLLEIWARGRNIFVVTEGFGALEIYITACIIALIALLLPWLQSILVLIMRRWFFKDKS